MTCFAVSITFGTILLKKVSWSKISFTMGECDTLYNEMTEAYDRLSLRLGIENQEDRDVEKIIGCLTSIGRHLALKMFEYGVILAQRDAGDS